MPRGHLSENDFQSVILKVTNAFLALGLTIQKIHDIEIQISFPTEELSNILKTVDDLDQNVREKEKKIKEKDNKLLERGKELLEIGEQRQVLEQQLQQCVSILCSSPKTHTRSYRSRF